VPQSPIDDTTRWESAIEHYHWDRLEEAYELIRHHGIGDAGSYIRWYRLIEAEHLSRLRSASIELAPWLRFEYVPEDVSGLSQHLANSALKSCEEIGRRLGWDHEVPTLIAVLAKEVDVPWSTHPFGYCADKYPYGKICLPDHLVDEPEEFAEAVAHEYAHVISSNLADGHAPRWLEESVSVLAEGHLDEEPAGKFRNDRSLWLSPDNLELAFSIPDEDDPDGQQVWMAYQQAGWIGRYLASIAPEKKLGDLLREHANESVWRNLTLKLSGKERFDGAIEAVYRRTTSELFEEAYDYLVASGKA
jgi:hypothetical protein